MLKKFINLYAILFFQGLIELIMGIITLTITTVYFEKFDSYNTFIEGLNSLEIGLFFALIFSDFASYLTIYIIIDIITPFYIFLVNILTELILFFFDVEKSDILFLVASMLFAILTNSYIY